MVKHIKKIALLLSASAILLFAGCNNLVDAEYSGDSSARSSYDGTLSIKLEDNNSFSRFLSPGKLTTSGISYYKITGESVEYGYQLEEKTYSSSTTPSKTDLESGNAKLTGVQLDEWTFTLWAYDENDNILLKGTSKCNLKSSNDTTITFNLSSYEVTTLGSYDINIKYTGSNWVENQYSFSWSLYNIIGECLTTSGAAGGTATTVDAGTSTDLTSDPKVYSNADEIIQTAGYKASGTSVNPGTYLFGVYLKNGDDVLAFASDLILIEPGRKTEADFEIGDILDSVPNVPTDFKVQRILGSEDAAGDFYNARFIWADASTNETEFYLILKEFTDTTTSWATYPAKFDLSTDNSITVYTAGSVLTQDGTETNSLRTDVRYVSGSLYAGSTELVLRLPTGHLFDFQILAKNKIGSSESVGRVADATSQTALGTSGTGSSAVDTTTIASLSTTPATKVTGYDVSASAPFYHVNLVRTIYNLNGGVLKTAENQTYGGSSLIEYDVYKLDTSVDLSSADKTDSSDSDYIDRCLSLKEIKATVSSGTQGYPTLKIGNTDFTEWQTLIDGSSTTTAFNVNDYENIVVDAVFGATTGDVTVSQIKIEDLPVEDATRILAYSGTDSSGTGNNTNAKNSTITVARKSSAKYVTVKVGPKAAEGTAFAKWRLYINGAFKEEITANESSTVIFSTFPTTKLKSGGNELMVVGVTSNGGSASSKFIITLGN